MTKKPDENDTPTEDILAMWEEGEPVKVGASTITGVSGPCILHRSTATVSVFQETRNLIGKREGWTSRVTPHGARA